MTEALLLLVGLLAGAAVVWFARQQEVAFLRKELREATDRLVHAWKADAVIPPRPVPVEPIKPLPPALKEMVDQWESPEVRAMAEAKLRDLYFTKGWTIPEIMKAAENEHEGHP